MFAMVTLPPTRTLPSLVQVTDSASDGVSRSGMSMGLSSAHQVLLVPSDSQMAPLTSASTKMETRQLVELATRLETTVCGVMVKVCVAPRAGILTGPKVSVHWERTLPPHPVLSYMVKRIGTLAVKVEPQPSLANVTVPEIETWPSLEQVTPRVSPWMTTSGISKPMGEAQ